MFLSILHSILFSLIFIFLLHYLFCFFRSTLTVPKNKDLVNTFNTKYQNIIDTLEREQFYKNTNTNTITNSNLNLNSNLNSNIIDSLGSDINSLPINDIIGTTQIKNTDNIITNNMKDELRSFLKQHLDNNKKETGNILI
jgi:hypothetical protein